MHPNVSIVVAAYNAEETIGKTLEACLKQDLDGDAEVIAVDDGSTDATATQIRKYPVKYIYQENRGPASARNRGWRAAGGEIVYFTDADCIPQRDVLSKLIANYCEDRVGAVGGSYAVANPESFLARCIQEEIALRHSTMPVEVRFLGSYNLSVKRAVLVAVGGFGEGYNQASGEDNDLSYRIREHGYKLVFDREALVAHFHPHNLWRYLRDQYVHGFWRARLYRKHPQMGLGDDYVRLKDIVEVPLCLGLMATGPLFWNSSLWLMLLGLLFIFQLEVALRISFRSGRTVCLLFAFVTFLRCFARSLGFLRGLFALAKRSV